MNVYLTRLLQFVRQLPLWQRRLAAGVIAALLIVLLLLSWIFWWPHTFPEPKERILLVPRGASFQEVTDSLVAEGVLEHTLSFRLAGRILGWTSSIRYGRYFFYSGVSNLDILRALKDGRSRRLVAVSIPEGLRFQLVARRFARDLGLDSAKFVRLCQDSAFVRSLGIRAPDLEGHLLPDTYFFHWQTEEEDVLEEMVASFKLFYADSLLDRQRELRMTQREVLTLASIVEAEARLPRERRTIAGVYHNRLKRRMRLEADPTIQYVLPGGPRRLLYSDLRYPSLYNTYLHYGLPPGPINNPGREAILAALYPEQHSYLFFVADGTGGHKFSTTYSEHQRAVRSYRRIRRELQRSAQVGQAAVTQP
jgi:UPF0755 protein